MPLFFNRKNVGTPMSAAAPKQRSCRLVRFIKTFVLTLDKSRGTEIYDAIFYHLLHQCAPRIAFARLPVLKSVKHSNTVYPAIPQMVETMSSVAAIVCTNTA